MAARAARAVFTAVLHGSSDGFHVLRLHVFTMASSWVKLHDVR
jgi:hypothetical protein